MSGQIKAEIYEYELRAAIRERLRGMADCYCPGLQSPSREDTLRFLERMVEMAKLLPDPDYRKGRFRGLFSEVCREKGRREQDEKVLSADFARWSSRYL